MKLSEKQAIFALHVAKLILWAEAQGYKGSSPHSWGTVFQKRHDLARRRFIPTLVGNGHVLNVLSEDVAVHPHTRGERTLPSPLSRRSVGSSPHSWGTVCDRACRVINERFIPTLVGNGRSSCMGLLLLPVHPHTRGERWTCTRAQTLVIGSSPHSWGTEPLITRSINYFRFIPTLVGNGNSLSHAEGYPAVHPHTRGEREIGRAHV